MQRSKSRFFTWTMLALFALVAVSVSQPCKAQVCGSSVPSTYLDLCNTLDTDLNAFNATLQGLGGGPYPVIHAGELTTANATNGPQVLNNALGVENQVLSLQAMGVQAIAVRMDFPMLYEPFFSSQSVYQQYVSFYSQVASDIKAAGMKLIVENTCMATGGVLDGWTPQLLLFYGTLDWAQYQAARAQTAQVIAMTMQPDYMVIVEEPDNEAKYCLQPNAYTVSGSTGMVDQIHSSVLLAGVNGLQVGAGVGSWLTNFQTFIDGYADYQCSSTQPCVTIPLDFVDMHIYPINNFGPPTNQNDLTNALTIAQTAIAAAKPIAISETWDWKVRNNEINVLSFDAVQSRNAFSFWEPLDTYFIQTMETLANYANMAFLVPFTTQNFEAYITYTTMLGLEPPQQIYNAWFAAAIAALNVGAYSNTGISYYQSNVNPPDTIPPTTPGNLKATSGSPTVVSLSWNASTDNVGVANYQILRGSTMLPNTVLTKFQDTGLTGGTKYTYTVTAFDLAGNPSVPAMVTIKTPNGGVPNPPTNLTAVADSNMEITLTWTPPASGPPPTTYLIFRGTSPTTLTQIGQVNSTTTTWSNFHLAASTTYYYGVESEAQGQPSILSNIASATTLP